MEDVAALIDKLIEEHKVILGDFRALEQVTNDATAIMSLDKAREAFVPGRFDKGQGLKKIEAQLDLVDKGLRAHFQREETTLLAAFEKYGGRTLVSALRELLLEHESIRERLVGSKRHLDELIAGKVSRYVWEASAHDMCAHIIHSRKLIQTHTENERRLFVKLKKQFKKAEGE